MIQKPNAAEPAQDGERSPLIEPEDLDIVPEVVPDSDDVATPGGCGPGSSGTRYTCWLSPSSATLPAS